MKSKIEAIKKFKTGNYFYISWSCLLFILIGINFYLTTLQEGEKTAIDYFDHGLMSDKYSNNMFYQYQILKKLNPSSIYNVTIYKYASEYKEEAVYYLYLFQHKSPPPSSMMKQLDAMSYELLDKLEGDVLNNLNYPNNNTLDILKKVSLIVLLIASILQIFGLIFIYRSNLFKYELNLENKK